VLRVGDERRRDPSPYLDLLRDAAPADWSWRRIYREPQPVIGSYNGNPLYAQAFAKARRWYGYLDR